MFPRMAVPALFLLSFFTLLQGQEPQGPVISISSRLVQLSAVVHDRKGQPVRDLKRDDFTVLDDGAPRDISIFSVQTSEAAPPRRSEVEERTISNRRLRESDKPTGATVLLFDSLNSEDIADLVSAKREVLKFLTQVKGGEQVALYSLAGSRVRIIHDFTDDTRWLVRAAERYTGQVTTAPIVGGPDIGDGHFAQLGEFLRTTLRKDKDFRRAVSTEWTLAAFEDIAHHLAGIPGRKTLIWLSAAFPIAIGLDPDSMAASKAIGAQTNQANYTERIKRLARILNDCDIAVYPVDVRGLMVDSGYTATAPTNNRAPGPGWRLVTVAEMNGGQFATMDLIAAETGGRAIYNANDLAGSLRRVVDDGKVTYLLGFYLPEPAWDGKHHNLTVKVNRPGVEVTARRGYLAGATGNENDPERDKTLRMAAASPLDGAGIGLTVNVMSNPLEWGLQQIVTVVDPKDVRFENRAGRWYANLDLVFVQQTPDGFNLSGEKDHVECAFLPATYAETLEKGLFLQRYVDIKPRAARLRVVARDASSGAIGSLAVPVEAETSNGSRR